MDEDKMKIVRERLEKYRYCHPSPTSLVINNSISSLEKRINSLTLKDNVRNDILSTGCINNHVFQNSTSSFNKKDMEVLSITIKEVYQLDEFFKYSNIFVETKEKEVLGDIARRAGEYECCRFDLELSRVLENNRYDEYCYSSTNEGYIDSLADTIFRISNIYDGQRFELLKPKNSLYICNKRYGSSADRELKVIQTGMVFMIEESKHISTSSYLKGDLQLACNLLVSHQQNKDRSGICNLLKPLPTVFAMKILATEVTLYFMNYDEEYLEYLEYFEKECKKKEVVVYKLLYNHSSIDVSYIRHMEILLNILSNIGESVESVESVSKL